MKRNITDRVLTVIMLMLIAAIAMEITIRPDRARGDEWTAADTQIAKACGSDASCFQAEKDAAVKISNAANDETTIQRLTPCAVGYYMKKPGEPGSDFYRFIAACAGLDK